MDCEEHSWESIALRHTREITARASRAQPRARERPINMTSEAQQMIEHIVRLIRQPNVRIDQNTALVSSGLIDSMSLVDLLQKIEDLTHLRIPPGKVQPKDLDTVGSDVRHCATGRQTSEVAFGPARPELRPILRGSHPRFLETRIYLQAFRAGARGIFTTAPSRRSHCANVFAAFTKARSGQAAWKFRSPWKPWHLLRRCERWTPKVWTCSPNGRWRSFGVWRKE